MMVLTLPASTYHGIIEKWTTPADRRILQDRGERLPDGRIRFKLPDDAATMLQEFMFEGETYQDAIERLMAQAAGQIA